VSTTNVVAGDKECTFRPLNNGYLGKVAYIVKFTRSNPNDAATNQNVWVKVSVRFEPAKGQFGSAIVDPAMTSSLGSLYLATGNTKLPGSNEGVHCTAKDGFEESGLVHATNALKGNSVNNQKVKSDGTCEKSSGTLPYFYKTGQDTLIRKTSFSPADVDSYSGVAVKTRFLAHFKDKRYKIADQSGVETLQDNIGDFTITAKGFKISSNYINVKGSTHRDDEPTTGLNLKRLDVDRYDGSTDKFAQYRFDHEHVLRYLHIKHVQETYLNTSCSDCTSGFELKGFSDAIDATFNMGTDAGVFPKADWDIYVLKIRVRARNGGVSTLDSNTLAPTYGLPVLPTEDSPQHPDGIPLSYLYEMYLEPGDKARTDRYDTVDSYDDGYELFTRLNIKATATVEERYRPSTTSHSLKCSSNRLNDGADENANKYGKGLVRDVGNSEQILERAQKYFDDCRIHITGGDYMSQVILTWNEAIETRCCVPAESQGSIKHNPFGLPSCDDTLSEKCINRLADVSAGQRVKLTVVDDRIIKIGSTELSLLRRKEIVSGHGVQVAGDKIMLTIAKQDGKTDRALKFDIWGTSSMVGYDQNADRCTVLADPDNPNLANVQEACSELHGCELSNGIFAEKTSPDPNCAEKYVTLSKEDNEYVGFSIRSTSQCNGKLDIQLRSADTSLTNNLLKADEVDGFLRPVYDVRLPCARVSNKVSDSIKLKFGFEAHYTLTTDTLALTLTGDDSLDEEEGNNQWKSSAETNRPGYTESMLMTGFIGTCQGDHTSGITQLCTGKDVGRGSAGVLSTSFDASSCSTTKLTPSGTSLQSDVDIGILYTRTFKYDMNRGHQLDPNVAPTTFTDTKYFCRHQNFKISVNAEKTASISITTPVQAMMERMAQISEVGWVSCGSSTDQYKLQVKVDLKEQNVQSPNDNSNNANDWSSLPSDFTISNVDGFSVTAAGAESKLILSSQCIKVKEDEGGCSSEDLVAFSGQSHTTTLTITAGDDNLGTLKTGVLIDSNIEIVVDYDQCPLSEQDASLANNDFEIDLSFQNPNSGDNACLLEEDGTATDTSNNIIKNCKSALVTSSGEARLHGYVTDVNGDRTYVNGYLSDDPSEFKLNDAVFTLRRYTKLIDGSKGSELNIGDSTGAVLCELKTGETEITPKAVKLVSSQDDTQINAAFDSDGNAAAGFVKTGVNRFRCKINFLGFGRAQMLDDIFEIDVVAKFTSGTSSRRLRSTQRLNLQAGRPFTSSVGFNIVSNEATATDDVASNPSSVRVVSTPGVKAEGDKENNDQLWMVIWIVAGVLALVLLVVLAHCCGLLTVPQLANGGLQLSQQTKVFEKKKYSNLRY